MYQVRFHPYIYASYKDMLEYCSKHGIVIEAYGSLAYVSYLSLCPYKSFFQAPH